MTFLAEWGDRSQIATIALAAAKDPYGVVAGGVVVVARGAVAGDAHLVAVGEGMRRNRREERALTGRSRRLMDAAEARASTASRPPS